MEQHDTFNQVYYATRDALLRWLVPRVRASADVEDLMQEIYRKLYRKLLKRDGVREPQQYVFGIAKKELARYYRRRAAQTEHEEPIDETLCDESPSPENLVLTHDQQREIWTLVQAEPLKSYQAFTLYYGFSVPTDVIAKELNISEDAVRKRIGRTRQKIRQKLSDKIEPSARTERRTE